MIQQLLLKEPKCIPTQFDGFEPKKPKTRTGCQTCKLRRVKCGEEKPSCLRCLKFGIGCDGYAKLPSRSTAKTAPLLPRPTRDIPQLCILPTTSLFKNETEHQYFLYFRDEVASGLSGPFPTDIWKYIIFQATYETTALRNLTISISALSKWKSSPESTSFAHRSFAIHRYGKALAELRRVLTRSDDSAIRTSLIASLLIFCFENIHGDHEQAISQLRAALIMMRKRLSTSQKPYSRLRIISSIPGFEDDIIDVFVRLDNTIMSRVAAPTESRGSLLEVTYVAETFVIPHRFRDLREAKNYLEHAQYQAMPYLAHMANVLMYGDKYNAFPPRDEFDEIMTHFEHWTKAFIPLFEAACEKGGVDFIAAATLRVLALSTDIATQRIFLGSVSTSLPTSFVAQAREIVDLTRRVANERGFKKGFVVDCGIVPALFVVISLCGERCVREDAIRVLEDCGERMEITWSAAEAARIGRGMMDADGLEQWVGMGGGEGIERGGVSGELGLLILRE